MRELTQHAANAVAASLAVKAVAVNSVVVKAVDASAVMRHAVGNMPLITEEIELRTRIAQNLRKHRAAQGVSQEGLADLAGLHRTFVSKVERCITNLSVGNVAKLAKALKVDPVELLKP